MGSPSRPALPSALGLTLALRPSARRQDTVAALQQENKDEDMLSDVVPSRAVSSSGKVSARALALPRPSPALLAQARGPRDAPLPPEPAHRRS